ncbi:MAG: beta family protein, partial [Flavipsychrobacter sp.]
MIYYPILLSKSGELTALRHLTQAVKNETCPVFEILEDNMDALEAFLIAEWTFDDNRAMLDFSLLENVDPSLRRIRRFFDTLYANGVNAIPVVLQNSTTRFLTMVNNIVTTYGCNVCVRASNNTGFANYNTVVASLMAAVGTTRNTTVLLIDLGYAEDHNYNILSALAIALINGLPHRNQWAAIIVASG